MHEEARYFFQNWFDPFLTVFLFLNAGVNLQQYQRQETPRDVDGERHDQDWADGRPGTNTIRHLLP